MIQSLTGAKLGEVSKAAFPFFLVMIAFTILITFFPEIVLWLPNSL